MLVLLFRRLHAAIAVSPEEVYLFAIFIFYVRTDWRRFCTRRRLQESREKYSDEKKMYREKKGKSESFGLCWDENILWIWVELKLDLLEHEQRRYSRLNIFSLCWLGILALRWREHKQYQRRRLRRRRQQQCNRYVVRKLFYNILIYILPPNWWLLMANVHVRSRRWCLILFLHLFHLLLLYKSQPSSFSVHKFKLDYIQNQI